MKRELKIFSCTVPKCGKKVHFVGTWERKVIPHFLHLLHYRSLPPRRHPQSSYGVSLKLQFQEWQNLPNGRIKVVVNHQRNDQQKWFMFPTWMWSRRASKARCQRPRRQLHQEMLQSLEAAWRLQLWVTFPFMPRGSTFWRMPVERGKVLGKW